MLLHVVIEIMKSWKEVSHLKIPKSIPKNSPRDDCHADVHVQNSNLIFKIQIYFLVLRFFYKAKISIQMR